MDNSALPEFHLCVMSTAKFFVEQKAIVLKCGLAQVKHEQLSCKAYKIEHLEQSPVKITRHDRLIF